jgi:hypothetical protein
MTMVLGIKGDAEPYHCGVCSRQASYLGYHTGGSTPIMWLCEDQACVTFAKRIYSMSYTKLNYIEERAIELASDKTIEPILQTILTHLWDNNHKSLDEITGDHFLKLTDEIKQSKTLNKVFGTFLLSFSNALKTEIGSLDPPF